MLKPGGCPRPPARDAGGGSEPSGPAPQPPGSADCPSGPPSVLGPLSGDLATAQGAGRAMLAAPGPTEGIPKALPVRGTAHVLDLASKEEVRDAEVAKVAAAGTRLPPVASRRARRAGLVRLQPPTPPVASSWPPQVFTGTRARTGQ